MLAYENKNDAFALAGNRFRQRQTKKPRSFLSIADCDTDELKRLMRRGLEMKQGGSGPNLQEQALALLFQKTSTRTRCSFDRAAAGLGMSTSYIDWRTSNFMLADLRDEIIVLSRYYDVIVARMLGHEMLRVMSEYSEVPIINGMCDREHPCQALGDFMTLSEYFGPKLEGLRLAYIGDGNNICRSLALGAKNLGIRMTLCSPEDYMLDEKTIAATGVIRAASPCDAVREADVIYTDTWISIGQENEAEKRLTAFASYQVNDAVLAAAPPHALVMHCLPAHPGQEVTAEVLRSPRSIVFDQAENRMHVQKALLEQLLTPRSA